jgi:hypothetical protein
MKQHRGIYDTQFRATRPHLQPGRSGSSMKWIIITAFCVALTVFLVALANAVQTSGGSSAAIQKQRQLAHSGSPDLQVQPAPTRQAGIIDMHQGPFLSSVFTVRNFWQGPVGSDWVLAYAGAKPNADGTAGQGGIVLYTETINQQGGFDLHPLGTFLAPNSTALTTTAANGNLLTLRSTSGQVLTFDLSTHQYGLPV